MTTHQTVSSQTPLEQELTQQAPDGAAHDEFAPPEAWDAIAAGYAEFVAPGEEAALSAEALSLVGLRAGESFLDVAAGPGGLALAAARIGARVLATDWSPGMVAQFESRVRTEGLTAQARVMDVHSLDLEDDTFDVVGSQFGVMLVPEQPVALREMVRVARPGGRVLLVAYGSPSEFEALQFFIAALQAVVPEFEGLPDPPPLEFQVADPEVLRARLVAAGLTDVRVDSAHQERVEFSTGQDLWNWMQYSNPIVRMILGDVAEEDQRTVRDVLDGMLRERAGDAASAVLTAPLNVGSGVKAV